MTATNGSALRIGAWRLDPALDELSKDGNTVKLERRATQLLLCLAERAGQVVSVEQLLDQVWTGVVVTPDSVYHAVAALRRVLGDDTREPTYIANVPRRGYRLVAPVTPWVDAPEVPDVPAAPDRPAASDTPNAPDTPNARNAPNSPDLPDLPDRPVAISAGPTRARPPRWGFAMVVSIALALALGYIAANKLWLSKPASTADHGTSATALVNDKSIAVLPFVDLSEQKEQEYFADGMAEEILDLLATIPALKVIGRTSSFQFKGKNEDLRAIGARLGAAYVLEGSVRKSSSRVRVAAQLIDARDGARRWSGIYDRDVGDVLKLQDDIAAGIVRALQITVGAAELQPRPTLKNTDAYSLYLRGRYALDRTDEEGFNQAAQYFQQALELDPTSAATAAWLAWTHELQGEWEFAAPNVAFEHARREAESALRRDPTSAMAHVVLGAVYTAYDWNWRAADKELREALALAPSNPMATFLLARLSLDEGRWDEALARLNAAIAEDPLWPPLYQGLDWIQSRRGHLSEAEAAARHLIEISPTYVSAHYYLGLLLLARGKHEAALAEMQQETPPGGQLGGLAMAYYALGRKAESDAALARMTETQADILPFTLAEAYAFRGEREQAFQWLERAYLQRESDLQYVKGDLPLTNLQGDPRYKRLLRQMHLPE